MEATMRIAEVADRSGFSAATLRYYEQLDLLPSPRRTAAGYRAYDESVLERLAFVRRAKRLGCSLEEIADLMADWESRSCAPLQERLRALAAAKLGDARARRAELAAFAADLEGLLSVLGSHTPDGPCDSYCGCVSDPATPVACTLHADERPARLREWRDVVAHVVGRVAIDGGTRLQLDPATPLAELAVLMRAEQECCRFFAFALTVDIRGVALEVRAPAQGMAMVDALFAEASAGPPP